MSDLFNRKIVRVQPAGIPSNLRSRPTRLLLVKMPDGQVEEIAQEASPEQISTLVKSEAWRTITFVVIQIDENNWLECSGSLRPEDGLSARYCVEGEEYVACRAPDSLDMCINLLVSYNQKDNRWLNMIEWCTTVKPDNQTRITNALTALLQRRNSDAFVILEEKSTGKFVQFAGSSEEPLLLDLPFQALTKQEIKKAISALKEFGAGSPQEYDVYTDENMETVAGRQTSLQAYFGQDTYRAAQASMTIFEQVYGLPRNFALNIEEN